MPNQQILNFMNQGAPPLISEQVNARDMAMAQGYADVNSSMANTEMQRMKNDSVREQNDILKNFEGRTNTPEFESKMGAVNPDMVMKMREQASKMDKAEREKLKERFEKVSAMAVMDNTQEAWKKRGWKEPFENREQIISMGMTLNQALDYKEVGSDGTALMKNTAFLEKAGFSKDEALDHLLKTKEMSKDAWERRLVEVFTKDITTRRNAKKMAKDLADEYYGESGGGRSGRTPQGFQSGAGPSSGKDYSNLWGGGGSM